MQPSSSLFIQPAWVVYHQLPSCKKNLVQVGHCVCVNGICDCWFVLGLYAARCSLCPEAVPRTPWLGYGLRSTNPMHGREDAR